MFCKRLAVESLAKRTHSQLIDELEESEDDAGQHHRPKRDNEEGE